MNKIRILHFWLSALFSGVCFLADKLLLTGYYHKMKLNSIDQVLYPQLMNQRKKHYFVETLKVSEKWEADLLYDECWEG